MLRSTAYDTVCHGHLEYYLLRTVRRILSEADLEHIEVRFNRVNGGSFAVTAAAEIRRSRLTVYSSTGSSRRRNGSDYARRAPSGDSRSASSSTGRISLN